MVIEFDLEQKAFLPQLDSDLSHAFFFCHNAFWNHHFIKLREDTVAQKTQYTHLLQLLAAYHADGEPQTSCEVNTTEFAAFHTGKFRSLSSEMRSTPDDQIGNMVYKSYHIKVK